jgi:hypothetical protein
MSIKMIELNLLPAKYQEKVKPKSKKLGLDIPQFIPLAVAGLVVLLVGVNMLSYMHKKSYMTKFHELKQEVKKTKKEAEQARTLEEGLPELRQRNAYLTRNVENKLLCSKVMKQVSRRCPSSIKIKDIKISRRDGKNLLQANGDYKSNAGNYLEEKFRTSLEEDEVLSGFFKQFRAKRTPGADGITSFTIIGGSS